ncbi:hypothetical protein ACP70R_003139 [Stipagrostis hirtigluma subsp. patula]
MCLRGSTDRSMDLTGSTTLVVWGTALDNAVGSTHFIPTAFYCVDSAAFLAGGFFWFARFFSTDIDRPDRFAIYLQLLPCDDAKVVRASFEVTVVDPSGAMPPRPLYTASPEFAFESGGGGGGNDLSGARLHVDKAVLRDWAPVYAAGGRLRFECTVTVYPEPEAPETPPVTSATEVIDVPPTDMTDQLGEILESHEGADVVFSVDGELFPAHRLILAMRSPVFKAELYDGMTRPIVAVDDMRAGTFRALLRYIYTDSSPADGADEGGGGDADETAVRELLVAAERYGVERLKLICERVLCKKRST